MKIEILKCPSCGASISSQDNICKYCQNYIFHFSSLEKKDKDNDADGLAPKYFRSLASLYKFSFMAGFIIIGLTYIVMFNFLTESNLLHMSFLWFLLIHFGITGYFSEKAIKYLTIKKTNNFNDALNLAINDVSIVLGLITRLVFIPVFLLLNTRKNISSPLKISIISTLTWAIVLLLFIELIFPNL